MRALRSRLGAAADRRIAAIDEASASGVRSEAAAFWRSVRGAQLLLAGSFSRADSDALVDGVRRTLLPMLPPPPAGAPAASAGTGEAEPLVRSEVLAEWGPQSFGWDGGDYAARLASWRADLSSKSWPADNSFLNSSSFCSFSSFSSFGGFFTRQGLS